MTINDERGPVKGQFMRDYLANTQLVPAPDGGTPIHVELHPDIADTVRALWAAGVATSYTHQGDVNNPRYISAHRDDDETVLAVLEKCRETVISKRAYAVFPPTNWLVYELQPRPRPA